MSPHEFAMSQIVDVEAALMERFISPSKQWLIEINSVAIDTISYTVSIVFHWISSNGTRDGRQLRLPFSFFKDRGFDIRRFLLLPYDFLDIWDSTNKSYLTKLRF